MVSRSGEILFAVPAAGADKAIWVHAFVRKRDTVTRSIFIGYYRVFNTVTQILCHRKGIAILPCVPLNCHGVTDCTGSDG